MNKQNMNREELRETISDALQEAGLLDKAKKYVSSAAKKIKKKFGSKDKEDAPDKKGVVVGEPEPGAMDPDTPTRSETGQVIGEPEEGAMDPDTPTRSETPGHQKPEESGEAEGGGKPSDWDASEAFLVVQLPSAVGQRNPGAKMEDLGDVFITFLDGQNIERNSDEAWKIFDWMTNGQERLFKPKIPGGFKDKKDKELWQRQFYTWAQWASKLLRSGKGFPPELVSPPDEPKPKPDTPPAPPPNVPPDMNMMMQFMMAMMQNMGGSKGDIKIINSPNFQNNATQAVQNGLDLSILTNLTQNIEKALAVINKSADEPEFAEKATEVGKKKEGGCADTDDVEDVKTWMARVFAKRSGKGIPDIVRKSKHVMKGDKSTLNPELSKMLASLIKKHLDIEQQRKEKEGEGGKAPEASVTQAYAEARTRQWVNQGCPRANMWTPPNEKNQMPSPSIADAIKQWNAKGVLTRDGTKLSDKQINGMLYYIAGKLQAYGFDVGNLRGRFDYKSPEEQEAAAGKEEPQAVTESRKRLILQNKELIIEKVIQRVKKKQ